jgi:pimeloyl-ACP methyl ester carboxylesterase
MATKTDLVLVPGLLCTEELFSPQVKGLADVAHVSVAEHRGFDSMQAIAESILKTAPPKFALAGLSMGGYIALEMIRQTPDRVIKLALLDSSARADRPEQSEQRLKLVALAREKGLPEASAQLWPLFVHRDRLAEEDLRATVVRMAVETGIEAFARQQQAIIGRADMRPFLAEIHCPTVVIVGAEDALTPVKLADEIHAGITGSHLEVIPDCGHLSTLERPEAVNAHLRTWLSS